MGAEFWPVPASMAERAARFAAEGGPAPEPRVAATVVLLREIGPGPDAAADHGGAADGGASGGAGRSRGFEVYAIRRLGTMAFGGMYAFPGGGVDPSDRDATVGWAGHPLRWWAERLRLPADRARAVVCAAVRELFEEAGVLLAGPTAETVVADAGAPYWEEARRALAARERGLTGVLTESGMCLRGDLLLPWSRWITPEFEPRRFDTYFFLALLPAGQLTRDVSGEADHTLWISPAEAVDRNAAGEFPMLPPTVTTLRELAGHPDVGSVLAAAANRDPAVPIRPRLVHTPDGTPALTLP